MSNVYEARKGKVVPMASKHFQGWRARPKQCNWLECLRTHINCSGSCFGNNTTWDYILHNYSVGNQLPDVRLLRKVYLQGIDSSNQDWPPPMTKHLCTPLVMTEINENDDNSLLIDGVPIRAVDDSNVTTSLLCMVYTVEESHATRIRAIRESWAGMCDGFLAFSTKTDFRIPSISIPHKGAESYQNMWQKVRSIWKFVGTFYLHDFDYFLIGGDDMFVIPQNLRLYLSQLNGTPDDNQFLGRRFRKPGTNIYFYSGGSGYVLSRGAVRNFLDKVYSYCHVDVESSEEDVLIADCFKMIASISVRDTRDEHARERFHPFSPRTHLLWRPEFTLNYPWYKQYSEEWELQYGLNCCSHESVTFHYISNPVMMRNIYCLIYRASRNK